MYTKQVLPIVFGILLLYCSSAIEWSFNFPYYLLLGGITESVDQPFKKFVTDYGYPVEVHPNVQTEDGYLLTLFRIPYGIKGNNSDVANRPAVLLVHGLVCSAEDWVVLGPEKGFAFILADAGYDVWLANMRGNTHSRKHVKYNPNWNGKFWNFSFHELGYYDLAASVDYVLANTKQEQLYYVGHSQGGTTFFVLNSMRPEYNKRFKLMVALAPGVLSGNTRLYPIRALSISNTIDELIFRLGFTEILPHLRLYSLLGNTVCKVKGIPQVVCKKLHFSGLGGMSDHFDLSLTPKVMHYQYAGSAFKQVVHFGHLTRYKRFCRYDYGKRKNLEIYGTETPPNYNLTNVVVPIAYYYGKADSICVLEDQINSVKLFPNIVDDYLLPYEKFTHMDMIVGNDAPKLAYERALKLMKRY